MMEESLVIDGYVIVVDANLSPWRLCVIGNGIPALRRVCSSRRTFLRRALPNVCSSGGGGMIFTSTSSEKRLMILCAFTNDVPPLNTTKACGHASDGTTEHRSASVT